MASLHTYMYILSSNSFPPTVAWDLVSAFPSLPKPIPNIELTLRAPLTLHFLNEGKTPRMRWGCYLRLFEN